MVAVQLAGRRALDLSGPMGFVCGTYLAAMGVDVIKVEQPGGDDSRLRGPFHGDLPDPEGSLYWKAFNLGKRAVTLDFAQAQGRDILKQLVATADFVIESFAPGFLDSVGCGYHTLRQVNPKVVMISITPFGQTGPYSHYLANDLVAAAMGGVLDNTGDADRPPVKEALDSVYFHGGAAGALGGLIAHFHSGRSGVGQHVDVSLQHCALARCPAGVVGWQFDQALPKRQGSQTSLGRVRSRWIWECRDGHIFWHMLGGMTGAAANKAMSAWIDEVEVQNPLREVTEWKEFDKAAQSQEQWDRFEFAIAALFRRFTKAEIEAESRRRGVNAAAAKDPAEVLAHEQLSARGYWQAIDDPAIGSLQLPRYPFLSDVVAAPTGRPAPSIGQHNDAVFREELGIEASTLQVLRSKHVI
jgi:crotonobetainyl-CoA:carnitine CoA-transferase CaiB-like acyl-CoA transferase